QGRSTTGSSIPRPGAPSPDRGRSPLELDAHLVAVGGQPGAELAAVFGEMGELGGLVGEPAEISLVLIIVAHEDEARILDPAAARGDARNHADPVGMAPAAMAGVEREAAEAVEDRPALVDLDRQAVMRPMADHEISAAVDCGVRNLGHVFEDLAAESPMTRC